jgi:RhtB (resistance to homoserine/threonine) family protein
MVEAFAVAMITILAVVSPGADFAMVTRNSMVSRRAGIFTAIGISLGVLVHVSYSMLGIGLLIAKSIILFNCIKLAGAAYLIYLGITMLKAKKVDEMASLKQPSALSENAALRSGFFTNALNPKTTLFVVALFTQVIHLDTPVPVQLAYGAFMSATHLLWFIVVAYAFSSNAARSFVATSRHLIERAIGGVLVALGLGLAASSLRDT